MRVSAPQLGKFGVFLIINVAVYLIVSFFLQKSMFSAGEIDGFYQQMQHIAFDESGSSSPLYYVHLLRFLAVSPFFYLYANQYPPFFESLLILTFLLPILTAKFEGKRAWLQVVFIYLPFFFSYRAVLVMCAMAYLFICMYGSSRRYFLLFTSLLLANLSSGVVLPWLMIVGLGYSYISRKYRVIIYIAIGAVIVFSFSLVQKYDFFFNSQLGASGLIERSTFYVSFINGQYFRLFIYVSILLAWMVIGLSKITSDAFSTKLYLFFIPFFVTLFFEGLGVVSYIIPIVWFFIGVRPSKRLIYGAVYSRPCIRQKLGVTD